MRSSIACARCRRSKVKCINNGVNTTCRACETTGRECTYPSPAGSGAGSGGSGSTLGGASIGQVHRREESSSGLNGSERSAHDDQTPKRQRLKRSSIAGAVHAPGRDGVRAAVDALDHSLLTPRVWTELFEIWQQHFSIDLPFLHPPTFLKPLRSAPMQPPQLPSLSSTVPVDQSALGITPPASPMLLCAFLALTSRFHPLLVAHHSPPSSSRPSNPLIAAGFYAAASKARLAGNLADGVGIPDLERTQALLMLALHDWGIGQGSKAWISLGIAIRNAQVLGLQYEAELDDEPHVRSLAPGMEFERRNSDASAKKAPPGKGDAFIELEIRRRTFWSCFIMDRYLSTGKFRPLMLNVRDFRIQLPSSDRAFLFGEKVRTLMLSDEVEESDGRADIQKILHGATNGDRHRSSSATGTAPRNPAETDEGDAGRWELGQDEGIVSRYVKAADLYGRIVRYSCCGGRRRDKMYPPWHDRSTYATLLKQVHQFRDRLPRDLTLTAANISAHVTSRTSTSYALLHATLTLCTMILHREFLPFLPLKRIQTPGSSDRGGFHVDELSAPTGFYDDSAKQLFKNARDIIDLLQTCQEWGSVVQTPIVGFAAYFAALLGVYSVNFPWMDPDGNFNGTPAASSPLAPANASRPDERGESQGLQAARRAIEMVGNMRRAVAMANGWLRTLQKTHAYFSKAKRDFRASSRSPPSTDTSFVFGGRPGQMPDGAEVDGADAQILDSLFRDLVGPENEDTEMAEAPETIRVQLNRAENMSVASSIKNENNMHDGASDTTAIRQERWNAINSSASTVVSRQDSLPMLNGVQSSVNPISNPPTNRSPPINQAKLPPPDAPSQAGQTLPSISASPMISPSSHNPNSSFLPPAYPSPSTGYPQQPLYSPKQVDRSVLPPPNTSQPPPTLLHSPWSLESRESWLKRLDLRFTGDDVSAFVEGSDWSEWALFARDKHGLGGWLYLVWGGSAF